MNPQNPSPGKERPSAIGIGPFFEGHNKAIKAHDRPNGLPCSYDLGLVLKTQRYTFYNQRAWIRCNSCGKVVVESS